MQFSRPISFVTPANKNSLRRPGFTLVEIVVAVAIMALLTAVTLPTVAQYLSDQKIATTASTLTALKNGIATFRANVVVSPSRLTHLTRAITSTDTTSCTGRGIALPFAPYGSVAALRWSIAGPYYPKALSTYGLQVPIGTISDTLSRTAAAGTASYLNITIRNVRFQDAVKLNDLMDGTADVNQADRSNTTGAVQWGVPDAHERVSVTYSVSIGRLC